MNAAANNNPFVGLRPFESDETLLFFGRQEQTLDLLQRLHQYNFVGVIGSSGSGKSSIIRAGVIPRLRAGYLVNDRDQWAVCIMKPGESPICNLADAILDQLPGGRQNLSTTALEQKIKEEGLDALLEVLQPFWTNNINLFLLVDQFEELFRFSLDQNDFDKKDEAIDFVNILLELIKRVDLPVYVTITMRSDFIGDCSQIYGLPEALNQSQYLVPRLTRVQLKTAIEGPIKLYNGKIEDSLTSRLLNDVQLVKDELPLLQHALMRMWEREKTGDDDIELDMEDYEAIGGITKALSNHADEALQPMTGEELAITKKIFQSLTGIDEKGRKVRRPARLNELEALTGSGKETLLSIIDRFIEGNKNFLILSNIENKDDVLVDISHESLIRQWNKLNAWVDEEADSGKIYLRLVESAKLYEDKKKDLLTGNELHQIIQWYYTFKPGKEWAFRYSKNYDTNLAYLLQSEQEEKVQLARKRRNRRLLYLSIMVVFIMISGFAFFIYRNNVENKKQLTLNYWKSSQAARSENNSLEAFNLIAEAVDINSDPDFIQDLLIDGQAFLPATELRGIFYLNSIINHVAFSPDGKLIVTAGNDGNVRIIDKATGKQMGKTIRQQWPLMSAIFSRDGKMILTAGNDKTARIWNAASGKEINSFLHDEAVSSAVFNADETMILTSCADGKAILWEVNTARKMTTFQHPAAITSAAFSNDGKLIVTSGIDYTATIWSIVSRKKVAVLQHNKQVPSAVFSPDDQYILTACKDSTAQLWSVATKTQIASFKHNDEVTTAAFSPDGKWIVTGCNDKTARLWNVSTKQQVGTAMKQEGRIYSVAFSADGQWILSGGSDKFVRLWRLANPQKAVPQIIARHNGIVTGCVYSPDGTKFLTTSYDSSAALWDAATGKQLFVMKHNDRVTSAVFSSDGKWILTAGYDSTLRLWDAILLKQTGQIKNDAALYSAAFSPGNQFIVTTSADNFISMYNLATGKLVYRVGNNVAYKKAVFNPAGNSILVSGGDSAAHIFDSALKTTTVRFAHDNIVSSATFNNDGTQVVTAGWDMTARLWNATTLTQTGSDLKHKSIVSSAAFSNNNRWIVTGGFDSAAHIWSKLTLKELGAAKQQNGAVTNAVFSPNDQNVLTSGYDSTARIWPIVGDLDLPPALFKLQANATTGVQYNVERSETQCIPTKKWKALMDKYEKEAQEHAKVCKYPQYNLWLGFHDGPL